MKKSLKITLGILGGIIILFVADLVCVFTIHRPLFAIEQENGRIYKGILYDIYNCEEYSVPQIKTKGIKFSCVEDKELTQTSNKNFKVERYSHHDTIKYYPYYENKERIIYFAGNIKEFYIIDDKDTSLKDYVTTTYQTFEDSINSIIEKMDKIDALKDGGTTIYKSKELDLTITVCNTIDKNKNIYFDNYQSTFDNTMCK